MAPLSTYLLHCQRFIAQLGCLVSLALLLSGCRSERVGFEFQPRHELAATAAQSPFSPPSVAAMPADSVAAIASAASPIPQSRRAALRGSRAYHHQTNINDKIRLMSNTKPAKRRIHPRHTISPHRPIRQVADSFETLFHAGLIILCISLLGLFISITMLSGTTALVSFVGLLAGLAMTLHGLLGDSHSNSG